MSIVIIVSSNAANLVLALEDKIAAVVEAEYGSVEVMGSSDLLTLNHHVRPERPCPCSIDSSMFDDVRDQVEVIGLSHFDLDTLGGVCAVLGVKPEHKAFWACAEFVDTKGPHRVRECSSYSPETHELLASFWAWSQQNRLFAPKDGSVADCTQYVQGAIEELKAILGESQDAKIRGREFLTKEEALKVESYVKEGVSHSGLRVVLRRSGDFVNHLYYMQDGSPADIVVGFGEKFQNTTVSRAFDDVPVNTCEFVKEMWGELAGGHAGIAGSPRGQVMTIEDAEKAFESLLAR